ncbi:MAG: hypothetical protein HZT41_06875 [Dechloromonas sp.]|nr:MAG: hypothetical protein HZT41_06875 [Dechloromonas sp.]
MLSFSAATAFAGTDFTCVADCQSRGYQYQLCMQRCSYGDSLQGSGGGRMQGYMDAQQFMLQQQKLQEQQMRNQMIQNANVACQQGNQRACADLRAMLFNGY